MKTDLKRVPIKPYSMSNLTDDDRESLLQEINNEKAKLFTPVFIYVGILMVAGTLGNGVVLYFYGIKSKKKSPPTSFIIALSLFDLVTCLVGMPMEVTDLRFYVNFESVPACKALRFMTHFTSISSCLTLIVIAVDRYRRICKPFAKQINDSHVRIACILIGLFSILLSWPAIVFNDVVEFDLANDQGAHLKGFDCTTTRDEALRPFMFVINIVYMVAFLTITASLAVLYSFIGKQLHRHRKFRFYVAKKGGRGTRISINSASNASSDENLLTSQAVGNTTGSAFDEPPDASASAADLKEFVTSGMPEIEHDRPFSGHTSITGTTAITAVTDLSGKSKRSLHSTKSVTICDPSQNQVFQIESRKNASRQEIINNDKVWSHDQRPGSASSLATFSSRPSSATFSTVSEVSKRDKLERRLNLDLDDDDTFIHDDMLTGNMLDARASVEAYLQSTSRGGSNVDLEREGTDILKDAAKVPEASPEIQVATGDYTTVEPSDEENASVHNLEIETMENTTGACNDENDEAIGNTTVTVSLGKDIGDQRPSSRSSCNTEISEVSKHSKSSSKSRRSNVISPDSNITSTTSVASRASSVRRFKRFLAGSFISSSSSADNDTNTVKRLRMKLLDVNTIKYTMIMLIITVVFVVSFLPYLALVVWRSYNDEHEVNTMRDVELVFFQIGIRSVFLNSALNPLIYGGFNSKFRAFIYGAFCSCCRLKARPRDQSDSTSGT